MSTTDTQEAPLHAPKNEFGNPVRTVMPRAEDGFFGLQPNYLTGKAGEAFSRPSGQTNHGQYLDANSCKPAKKEIHPL